MNEQVAPQKNKKLFWAGAILFIALVVAVAFYLYWKYGGEDQSRQPKNYGKIGQQELRSDIDNYVGWADSLPQKRMNVDHTLTGKGFNKIADVLTRYRKFSVNGNKSSTSDIVFIRSTADSLSVNWKSGRHADMIKEAFFKSMGVITAISSGSSDRLDDELTALNEKVEKIDEKTLTLNQRDDVKDAFQQLSVVFKQLK